MKTFLKQLVLALIVGALAIGFWPRVTSAQAVNGSGFSASGAFPGPVTSTNGIIGAGSPGGTGGISYGSATPITLFVKSVPVKTSGSPATIATINIPNGITRWAVLGSNADGARISLGTIAVAETSSGSLDAASVEFQDGNAVLFASYDVGPTSAGTYVYPTPSDQLFVSTSSSIKIRQDVDSASSGTCSFYVTIYPIP